MNDSPVAAELRRQRFAEIAMAENKIGQAAATLIGYQTPQPIDGWQQFAEWCGYHGVSYLPARPAIVAAYILDCHLRSVAFKNILDQLCAIGSLHDDTGNPVMTAIVGAALDHIAPAEGVKAPAGWRRQEKVEFYLLPMAIQQTIVRREADRERYFSKSLNALADERRKLQTGEHESERSKESDVAA